MEKTKAIPLLTADDIDVKVKQVVEDAAYLLLYKNARVDMRILDEVFGEENWESDYKVVKDNLYAGIGVYFADSKRTVWKWDCGIESREDNGNEKKGEASDAFKRAAFKWGIGRELYSAPVIKISAETKTEGKGYKLKFKKRYKVKDISYDELNTIKTLVIEDEKGFEVFSYPKKITTKKNEDKPKDKTPEETPKTPVKKPFDVPDKETNEQKVLAALQGTGWTITVAERSSMKKFARSIEELNAVQLKSLISDIEKAKGGGANG